MSLVAASTRHVEGKVRALERAIDALDADNRVRELEARRDAALARLRATLR